jgi:hypothetical protein
MRDDVYQRSMRRLTVTIRVLATFLGAAVVQGIVDGVNVAVVLAVVLTAALLVAAIVLMRHGRALRPTAGRQRHPPSRV